MQRERKNALSSKIKEDFFGVRKFAARLRGIMPNSVNNLIPKPYGRNDKKTSEPLSYLMSRNLNCHANKDYPLNPGRTSQSETLKNTFTLILWNKIVSLKTINVRNHENCPMSVAMKTILMITALVLLTALPVLVKGIFFDRHFKPMLIDLPRSYFPEPLYLLTKKPVLISGENQFGPNRYRSMEAAPISACALIGVRTQAPDAGSRDVG